MLYLRLGLELPRFLGLGLGLGGLDLRLARLGRRLSELRLVLESFERLEVEVERFSRSLGAMGRQCLHHRLRRRGRSGALGGSWRGLSPNGKMDDDDDDGDADDDDEDDDDDDDVDVEVVDEVIYDDVNDDDVVDVDVDNDNVNVFDVSSLNYWLIVVYYDLYVIN